VIRSEIEDANVDVLITTGSTAPDSDNSVRHVLRDLDARWLIDGVAVTPGAQMLLARLPDGRMVVGLPGSPQSAFAGLVTLVSPIIRALRGVPREDYPTAVLVDDAPRADFADDTRLAPVRLEDDGAYGLLARPMLDSGPAGLIGWGNADAIAIVPPGTGIKGDTISLIML
jgi:molybdopterin molybdotransferase